jgi:pimeloyl-ACP methyl ester carboxylesterase
MSKLLKISGCDNGSRIADVIFLHGLGGDVLTTWRFGDAESTSWPHWIGAEFPEVGVWSVGYAASPTKWSRFRGFFSRKYRDSGHSMPLPDRALQVLDLMSQRDLGTRPILFICHSLGGLLAKQILRAASDSAQPQKNSVFAHTRGILFLATPHAGASLASMVSTFRKILGATVSIEDLRAHDAHLRNLLDWYRNHSANIRTVTYFETRDVFGARIVDQTSAHPGVGVDPVGLDEDHISIAKPRDKEAQVCGAARDLLLNHISVERSQSSPSRSLRSSTTMAKSESREPHIMPTSQFRKVLLNKFRPEAPATSVTKLGPSPFHPFGAMALQDKSYITRGIDRQIQSAIQNHNFIWLQGDFQTGKSSLLRRHPVWLGGQWHCVSPDLELCDRSTEEKFWRDFFAEIKEANERWQSSAELGADCDWRSLKFLLQSHKIAFLLDEIGTCKQPQIRQIFENLFSLSEKLPGNIKLIVGYIQAPADFFPKCGIKNPKHTSVWKVLPLGMFTQEDVESLIAFFPKSLANALMEKIEVIQSLTGFKPQNTQHLLHRFWESLQTAGAHDERADMLVDEWLKGEEKR